MNPLISIITPVYNAERYLENCIASVLAQTYPNWELLLINDGSTDNSRKICENASNKDERIKSLSKENTGVSDTRNIGLDMATGTYIMFLDADDYWCLNSILEIFVNNILKKDLDILRGEYKKVDEESKDLFYEKINQNKQNLANKVLASSNFLENIIDGKFFLCLSIFKKESIGNLRFSKGQIFLEDMDLFIHILLREMNCMYVPVYFYAYRENRESASHNHNIKKLKDTFSMCYKFHNCSLVANNSIIKNNYERSSLMIYYYTLCTIAEIDNYYSSKDEIIKILQLDFLFTDIKKWMSMYNFNSNNIAFHLMPYQSISILRIWIKLKIMLFPIWSIFKSIK